MLEIKCPHNGEICSDFFKRGVTEAGSQRYTCRKCKFTTVAKRKEKKTSYTSTKRGCCRNERIVANGTYKVVLPDGMIEVRQRYICLGKGKGEGEVCKKGFSKLLHYKWSD